MAKKHDLIKEITDTFHRNVDVLIRLPEELSNDLAGTISDAFLSFEEDTFDNHMKRLHLLSKEFGKYKVSTYWLENRGKAFQVCYSFEDSSKVRACFKCSDIEIALAAVGKGNCKIEPYTIPAREEREGFTIKCDL